MDRRVKERLIGATILVALVVLLVPEFLSGPHTVAIPPAPSPAGSVRTYRVDVATIDTAPPAPQPSPASAPAIEPAPVSAPAPVAAPPPVAVQPPVVKQPAAIARAPAAAAGWTLQLGSFASKANAESLMRRLKTEGFNAYLAPTGTARAQRFRVRLGPIADRGTAAAIMAKLRAHRHASTLLPPTE
jgi:DedD protein